MPPLTRKQREIAEREELLLDSAREMLLERGYLGLTMDRLAAATEYSKGTLYQHFSCKEDLIAALLTRSGDIRARLFERATTFRGTTREKIGAIGVAAEIFARLYPHHEQAEKVIRAQSIRDKTSAERQSEIAACESRCLGAATDILREAARTGELPLAEGDTVENMTFGLWSLYVGAFEIMDLDWRFDELGFGDPRVALLRSAQHMLDGMGWTPLSSEHDYLQSRERVLREIFPKEARRAGLIESRA